jgi:hypothetical protein
MTRQDRMNTGLSACWGVAIAAVFAGCGESRGDLAPVTGNVKLDGQPLPGALIQFVPLEGKGVVSTGRTDDSGNYEMMATRTAMGASRGENEVRITTFEIEDQGGKQKVIRERVPTKYNSASELKVTVKPGRNKLDFDLQTEGGKVEQKKVGPAQLQ